MANVVTSTPTVLVADDNPDDLFFAERLLKKAGWQATITVCEDGREIVALLKAWTKDGNPLPRAVFLDVKMPNLGGFETLRWIRAQTHLAEMPVVMLSGSAERRDIELARSLGATDYFVKYPPVADFARVLNAAIAT